MKNQRGEDIGSKQMQEFFTSKIIHSFVPRFKTMYLVPVTSHVILRGLGAVWNELCGGFLQTSSWETDEQSVAITLGRCSGWQHRETTG